VPGPTYSDGDWLAFAEIDKAVAEAELLGVQANELADELQDLMSSEQAPLAIVQRMIDRLPSLANARAALVNRLPRGPRMLMTLLSARSRDLAIAPGEYPTTLLGSG
jgi:hypothetical protein